MILSSREIILIWLTLAVCLGAVTYFLGRGRFEEWNRMQSERQNLLQQITLNQRLVDQREEWADRLQERKARLPTYPTGIDVTPKLLESLEGLARQNGVKLDSITNDKENRLGEVSEVAIKCSWQANLEQCVRFLYALQTGGGAYKVRSLSVAPTGSDGMLKGAFTLDCAYLRGESPATPALEVTPLPAPSPG